MLVIDGSNAYTIYFIENNVNHKFLNDIINVYIYIYIYIFIGDFLRIRFPFKYDNITRNSTQLYISH